MPFPEFERVVYSNSPLVEVICQFQFPPILKISAEEPHEFQERVRHTYPQFEVVSPATALPQDAPDFLRPLLQATFQDPSLSGGTREYRFSDPAGEWQVFLSREALGLTTTAYERWEEFQGRIESLIAVLGELYQPSYFSRIGLRYKDLLSPKRTGNERLHWSDLIAKPLLGEIATVALEGHEVVGAQRNLRFELEPELFVTLSHGLVIEEGEQLPSYLIDADYHKEGHIDAERCLGDLERCHSYAGRVFRWCITDTLHSALGPVPA